MRSQLQSQCLLLVFQRLLWWSLADEYFIHLAMKNWLVQDILLIIARLTIWVLIFI